MTIHINTDYSFIPPYAAMILLSCAAGLSLQYLLNIKRGADRQSAGFITLLAPFMSLLFGLMLTYAASGGRKQGLSSMGGLFGMYLSVFVMSLIRKDRKTAGITYENCTLVLPLIYSIAKTGCFLAGCCHGIPYCGPFCVQYSGSIHETGCLFPVQLAESVVFFIIFVTGMIMLRKGIKDTALYILILSAAAKGLLDLLRMSHMGRIISLNQILCAAVIAATLICKAAVRKNRAGKKLLSPDAYVECPGQHS